MRRYDRFPEMLTFLASRPGGATAQELADHLGIDLSSAYRVLREARNKGVDLQKDSKVYRLPSQDREQQSRQVLLSDLQIRLVTQALAAQAAHSPSVRLVLDKLKLAQDETSHKHFAETPFLYIAFQDEIRDGLLDQIAQAARRRHQLSLDYCDAGGHDLTIRLDPYGIVQRRDHLYLVGKSHLPEHAGAVIRLRLDAIRDAATLLDTFPAPDFDIQVYARRDFGVFSTDSAPVGVRLHVSPAKAHAIARTTRHPSQQCEFLPDGSLIYALTVPLTPDLVWWIASYEEGTVEVLKPLELRRQVYEHARAVMSANRVSDDVEDFGIALPNPLSD